MSTFNELMSDAKPVEEGAKEQVAKFVLTKGAKFAARKYKKHLDKKKEEEKARIEAEEVDDEDLEIKEECGEMRGSYDATFDNIMDSMGSGCGCSGEPPKDFTPDMEEHFISRTYNHIKRVRKFIKQLPDMDDDEKRKRMVEHDSSKFEEPEFGPYVWLTWKYKCQEDGTDFQSFNPPADIEERMKEATEHHITKNTHHPEYWSPDKSDLTNPDDRDKPQRLIDASSMGDYDIQEMVCDWCSVSEEKDTDPREWAKANIGVRWDFTDHQIGLINLTITQLWGERD